MQVYREKDGEKMRSAMLRWQYVGFERGAGREKWGKRGIVQNGNKKRKAGKNFGGAEGDCVLS